MAIQKFFNNYLSNKSVWAVALLILVAAESISYFAIHVLRVSSEIPVSPVSLTLLMIGGMYYLSNHKQFGQKIEEVFLVGFTFLALGLVGVLASLVFYLAVIPELAPLVLGQIVSSLELAVVAAGIIIAIQKFDVQDLLRKLIIASAGFLLTAIGYSAYVGAFNLYTLATFHGTATVSWFVTSVFAFYTAEFLAKNLEYREKSLIAVLLPGLVILHNIADYIALSIISFIDFEIAESLQHIGLAEPYLASIAAAITGLLYALYLHLF